MILNFRDPYLLITLGNINYKTQSSRDYDWIGILIRVFFKYKTNTNIKHKYVKAKAILALELIKEVFFLCVCGFFFFLPAFPALLFILPD